MSVDASDRIGRYLEEIGADVEQAGPGRWAVRVPSAKRGRVAVGISCGDATLSLHAFFMRAPDRNHGRVHERLMRKHLATYAWRFAIDDYGDLFLVAQLPLGCVSADELDRLLGTLSTYVDEVYESVLRDGFMVPEGTVIGPPPGQA